MVDLPADLSKQNGHGTAVASMIIGQNALTPGVAPGAEIISIRIADDFGQSDSFLLAKGIVAAVDAGVRLINISMASFGDSALVRNAIEYARAAGSLIVAAAGNNGIDRVFYPAASVSGTSFSSPIVLGAIAAVKSWPGNEKLSMQQAADVAFSYLNDGGVREHSAPCLEAVFPDALVGKKLIRAGESTALTVAAVLGRW